MKFPFCKICKGKCCETPHLSKGELKRLKPKHYIKKGKLYQLKGICEFLRKDNCSLKYKPLACVIYPFLPTKRGWVIRTTCPFWYRLTKKDLQKVKREFAKRRKDWDGKNPDPNI